MNKQSDLLRWILGGLSISAVAVAITLVSVGKPLVPSSPPTAAGALQISPPVLQELPALAVSLPATDMVPAPQPTAPMQTAAEPPVASTQIWQCTTNGIKTFSNNPCGDKSSLVEVRALNTMNATPIARSPRAYAADPPNAYQVQEPYADEDSGYADNSYAVVRGFAFLPKKRIEHPHRPPPHHDSGPPPRRN
jgi:hypothetical protein